MTRPLAGGRMLLISLLIAACSAGGAPATSAPATSAPATSAPATSAPSPTAASYPIRVALQQPQGCMDALMVGKLVRTAASGLGLTTPGRPTTAVEWPFGYTAQEVAGRVSLLDETGKVVAREGDEITIGGGLGNNLWYACAPVTVTKPAG